MIGTTLGHYEILETLGSGGMGDVFRARDLSLQREVAIKFVSAGLVEDRQAMERLAREARLLAAVSHANIATIHSLEQDGDVRFLVLELVPGRNLAELLKQRLPMREALEICGKVAEALEAAHACGIVHRDLKPANVMVTRERGVKVIDFGIAKSRLTEDASSLTDSRAIMGTGPYMSPEQIRGAECAPGTDIWAFGCVLYESLAGRRPFERETLADTLTAVLEQEPDWSALPRRTPAAVASLVHRCLRKDPRARLRDLGDAGLEIRDVLALSSGTGTASITDASAERKRARRTIGWSLTGLAAAAVTTTAMILTSVVNLPPSAPTHRQITFAGDATDVAISPDARSIAYVTGEPGGHQRLMLADIGGGRTLELFASEQVMLPQWSPDGSSLTVAATDQARPSFGVYRIPRLGGKPRHLAAGLWSTWSPDGRHVASAIVRPRGFTVFSVETGLSTFVALDGYDFNRGLEWSPAGDRLAVIGATTSTGLFELFTVDLDGGNRRSLIAQPEALSSVRWARDGNALYVLRHRTTIADVVRIELGKPAREPEVVLAGLRITEAFNATFSLSADGRTLAYSTRHKYSNLWRASLIADGSDLLPPPTPLTEGTSLIEHPSISPDGLWVAYASTTGTGANIYKLPVGGGRPVQLTSAESHQTSPVWSPDGRTIAFTRREPDGAHVWTMRPDGTQHRRVAGTDVSASSMRLVWAPGSDLLFHRPGNQNFTALDVATGRQAPMIPESAYERRSDEYRGWTFSPQVAPDGRRIAIAWNRLPAQALWQITREPYTEQQITQEPLLPLGWSADGQSIYVVLGGGTSGGEIRRVPAAGGPSEVLFELPGNVRYGTVDPSSTTLIAAVQAQQADVFVVEGFDPRRR